MISMKIKTDNNLECIGIEFIKNKIVVHCLDNEKYKKYYLSDWELIHHDFIENIEQIMRHGHKY